MNPPVGALHFLVVDDDRDARATTVEYLKALGYDRITQARDGTEALRMLDLDPTINFVVSDWQMPMMDGLTLLQNIRSNPQRAQLPFLIATSPVSQEAEKVTLAAENLVNAYIIKPFRSETLKQKIDHMLQLSVYGPTKQVVVVDDDPDARSMVVEYLNQFGFKDIKAFPDGKGAIRYLGENHYQIGMIVSDWEMPEMSGIELLRICKATPELADIPFLMITSQGSMERMKVLQAARANVDQYLLKPFSGADLKGRIDDLLAKSQYRRETEALVAEASDHLEHGRYQRAEELFQEAVTLDHYHEQALRGLGDALIKTKGVQSSLPYYKRAVEANPLSAKSALRLAAAYEQIGWLDKAVALLLSAKQQIAFSAELHFHLGRLYNKKGNLAAAQQEFEKTLEIQLDHQEARLMLEMLNASRNK